MRKLVKSSLAVGSLWLFGCGGVPEKPATTPAPAEQPQAQSTTVEGEPASPEVPWAEKTFEQRKEYMATVVLPEMKKLFQEFDGHEFAEFKCTTCHGQNFQDVNFEMPNGLHPLPAENLVEAAKADDEKAALFMMEKVVPAMAKLLDTDVYSPETQTGFGCFNCHAKREASASAPAETAEATE